MVAITKSVSIGSTPAFRERLSGLRKQIAAMPRKPPVHNPALSRCCIGSWGLGGRCRPAIPPPVVLIVIVVMTGAPFGVTDAGEKLHVDKLGSPKHENEVVSLKPPVGVTVSVTVPLLPRVIVNEPGLAPMVKSPSEVTVVVVSAVTFAVSTLPTASVAML